MSDFQDTKNQEQATAKDLEQTLSDVFGGSSFSDDDLLKTVDKHALQLTATQIKGILWLKSFNNPLIERLVGDYLEIKHHNRSGELIIQALNAISLRKFISQFRFNINTTK